MNYSIIIIIIIYNMVVNIYTKWLEFSK